MTYALSKQKLHTLYTQPELWNQQKLDQAETEQSTVYAWAIHDVYYAVLIWHEHGQAI